MAQPTLPLSPSAAFDAMGAEIAHYSRDMVESAGQTARDLISVRTFEDVVRLEADFAKCGFEGFLTASMKLSELGYSLLGASVGDWPARGKS